MIFLVIASFDSFALFDDKTIEPFLGPYKISKNNSKNCPRKLTLMAMCTLGQLDLKHTKDFDFDFINFKGVNEGEMITSINGKEVEKTITKFQKFQLISNRKTYMKKFKQWMEIDTRLNLGPKKFNISKTQVLLGKKNVQLDCEYTFDEAENKRILEAFNSQNSVEK
ncbi:MAG: hypothetical protein K9K67_11635 [Bacteriovoracaceae bacterium]|nr:hypothetical protein [Bacteriovoracaceae bacterium]